MRPIELPRCTLPSSEIITLFHALLRAGAAMPLEPLHPLERCELGGLIQSFSPRLVELVARAMRESPGCFTHAPASGPDLEERQRQANVWVLVRNALRGLADQANDHYIHTQSGVARDAMATLQGAFQKPAVGQAPDPQHYPRRMALIGAYMLVDDFYKRIQKKKAARKKQALEGTPPPPPKAAPGAARRRDAAELNQQRLQKVFMEAFCRAEPLLKEAPPPPAPPPPPVLPTPPKAADTRANTDEERQFVEIFARHQGIRLQPVRPEDSLQHSAAELDQGRAQARALVADVPDLTLNESQQEGQRYPELGGVAALFAEGLRKNPGLQSGPLGDADLWTRLIALDRTNGRMIWTGQLLQHGGEAGELAAVAAQVGLCAGVVQRAQEAGDDPAASSELRGAVGSALCEILRMDADQAARELKGKKILEQARQPFLRQASQAAESGAMDQAIEGFLKARPKEVP